MQKWENRCIQIKRNTVIIIELKGKQTGPVNLAANERTCTYKKTKEKQTQINNIYNTLYNLQNNTAQNRLYFINYYLQGYRYQRNEVVQYD